MENHHTVLLQKQISCFYKHQTHWQPICEGVITNAPQCCLPCNASEWFLHRCSKGWFSVCCGCKMIKTTDYMQSMHAERMVVVWGFLLIASAKGNHTAAVVFFLTTEWLPWLHTSWRDSGSERHVCCIKVFAQIILQPQHTDNSSVKEYQCTSMLR